MGRETALRKDRRWSERIRRQQRCDEERVDVRLLSRRNARIPVRDHLQRNGLQLQQHGRFRRTRRLESDLSGRVHRDFRHERKRVGVGKFVQRRGGPSRHLSAAWRFVRDHLRRVGVRGQWPPHTLGRYAAHHWVSVLSRLIQASSPSDGGAELCPASIGQRCEEGPTLGAIRQRCAGRAPRRRRAADRGGCRGGAGCGRESAVVAGANAREDGPSSTSAASSG